MEKLGTISLEDLEASILTLDRAADLGHMEAIKRTIQDMRWMVQEMKGVAK